MCPCVSSSKYSYKNNTLPSRIGNNVRWNSPFNISATAPNNTHSRVALQPQIRRLPMTVGDGWRCTGSSYVYSPKPTAMGRKQKECCRLALCNVGTAVCGHIIAHQMQWLPILQLDWLCDKSLGIVIWRDQTQVLIKIMVCKNFCWAIKTRQKALMLTRRQYTIVYCLLYSMLQ